MFIEYNVSKVQVLFFPLFHAHKTDSKNKMTSQGHRDKYMQEANSGGCGTQARALTMIYLHVTRFEN